MLLAAKPNTVVFIHCDKCVPSDNVTVLTFGQWERFSLLLQLKSPL